MALMDTPPEVVYIRPRELRVDEDGNERWVLSDGELIAFPCWISAPSSTVNLLNGDSTNGFAVAIGRGLPADPRLADPRALDGATVVYNGVQYIVDGPPRIRQRPVYVRHVSLSLRTAVAS